jgi:hypothetical protein
MQRRLALCATLMCLLAGCFDGGRAPGIRGGDQQSLAGVETYTPPTSRPVHSQKRAAGSLRRVSTALAMPTARGSLAVVALGGRLYALGGESTPGTVSDAIDVMGAFAAPSDAVGSEAVAPYRFQP